MAVSVSRGRRNDPDIRQRRPAPAPGGPAGGEERLRPAQQRRRGAAGLRRAARLAVLPQGVRRDRGSARAGGRLRRRGVSAPPERRVPLGIVGEPHRPPRRHAPVRQRQALAAPARLRQRGRDPEVRLRSGCRSVSPHLLLGPQPLAAGSELHPCRAAGEPAALLGPDRRHRPVRAVRGPAEARRRRFPGLRRGVLHATAHHPRDGRSRASRRRRAHL